MPIVAVPKREVAPIVGGDERRQRSYAPMMREQRCATHEQTCQPMMQAMPEHVAPTPVWMLHIHDGMLDSGGRIRTSIARFRAAHPASWK